MRRKDGEIRTVLESSIAVKDAAGNVTAYQGFLLDITETEARGAGDPAAKPRAPGIELNRADSDGVDGPGRFASPDAAANCRTLQSGCVRAVPLRRRWVRKYGAWRRWGIAPSTPGIFPRLPSSRNCSSISRRYTRRFCRPRDCRCPPIFREAQRKEELLSAYIVVLWSKDRVIGGLTVGSRTPKEFSPADINLLITVGSQLSSAIRTYNALRRGPSGLREPAAHAGAAAAQREDGRRRAIDLRRGARAEQSAHGHSGLQPIAHLERPDGASRESNTPTSSISKRSARIASCRTLLSFARQHKPERVPVQLNLILEETLALRDYDLRMNHIRVHLELAAEPASDLGGSRINCSRCS